MLTFAVYFFSCWSITAEWYMRK